MPYSDLEERRKYHRNYMRWYREKSEVREKERHLRKDYHERNRDERNAQSRNWRQKAREKIQKYRADKGCCVCGIKDHRVLEFHHPNGRAKDDPCIGRIATWWNWERVLKEMEKCAVICRNCHAILHYDSGLDG